MGLWSKDSTALKPLDTEADEELTLEEMVEDCQEGIKQINDKIDALKDQTIAELKTEIVLQRSEIKSMREFMQQMIIELIHRPPGASTSVIGNRATNNAATASGNSVAARDSKTDPKAGPAGKLP